MAAIFLATSDAAHQCKINVSITPGTTKTLSSWYDIWAAGVEIQTICIAHGLNGTILYIGKYASLVASSLRDNPDEEYTRGSKFINERENTN